MSDFPTQFKVILDTLRNLSPKIASIQQHALDPGRALHGSVELRTSADSFGNIVANLRQVAHDAQDTADFLLSNVFSKVMDPNTSPEAKAEALRDFRTAAANNADRVMEPTAKLRHLQNLLNSNQILLNTNNFNTTSISNQIDTIEGAVASIKNIYTKISGFVDKIERRMAQGITVTADYFMGDIKWLATISADLKKFYEQI
ncbi:hypothetical protein QCA50_013542 [Cerrena zonata]|uniref:Uncharacterized protein n=1 Tax=Cerrena zonata TaxID=2478898 RepID=A0AAW0FPS4_9APHY